ncbi:MAG: hypothetical protein PVF56_03340 [Desulfobacterales bacterium]|jgi:hypothetical protein
MDDIVEIQIKTEIDEIMNNVDNIMKKVELLIPQKEEESAKEDN